MSSSAGAKDNIRNSFVRPLYFPAPRWDGCCLKAALYFGVHIVSAPFPARLHSPGSSAETLPALPETHRPWERHTNTSVNVSFQPRNTKREAWAVTFADVSLLVPSRSIAPLSWMKTFVWIGLPYLLLWVRIVVEDRPKGKPELWTRPKQHTIKAHKCLLYQRRVGHWRRATAITYLALTQKSHMWKMHVFL